jgi:uncharacterized protein involved in exopolysaccharide biosynthesis
MQEDTNQETLNLFEFWDFLMRYIKDISLITVLFVVLSLIYASTAQTLYRAQILMVTADEESSSGGLSSLAQMDSLAGFNLPSPKKSSNTYVAILKSRTFLEGFAKLEGVKQEIFSNKWNLENSSWEGEVPSDFKTFHILKEDVISISENVKTNVFTFSVVWHDPLVASNWANILISRLNSELREKAIVDAEKRSAFLKEELSKTNVVGIQNVVSAMIQSQLQKKMMANVKEQYAFKVIDPANIPQIKFSPNRTLIVILGSISGVFVGLLFAILRNVVSNYKLSKLES